MSTKNVRKVSTAMPDQTSDNTVRNTKYNMVTFVPCVVWQQFQSFSSLYFFAIMVAQTNSKLAISPFIASFAPWAFVLCLSLVNEGLDDYKRHQRDRESNSAPYRVWKEKAYAAVKSSDIKVGDLVLVGKGDRIPADCILLKTEEPSGEVFIRTDQLDGETDWKRRIAPSKTQQCSIDVLGNLHMTAELPHRGIYTFTGTIQVPNSSGPVDNSVLFSTARSSSFNATESANPSHESSENASVSVTTKPVDNEVPQTTIELPQADSTVTQVPNEDEIIDTPTARVSQIALDLDNTIWANTMMATSSALCLVIYTGDDTRSMMNTYKPRSKSCKIDAELNQYMLYLGIASFAAALVFTFLKTTEFSLGTVIIFLRFLMLFSYVIPISLKVTINLARICYVWMIQSAPHLDGVIVRSSSVQEELGRISFFLTDKTGTLTKNEMIMKKIHLGTTCYSSENLSEIKQAIKNAMKLASTRSNNDCAVFKKAKNLETRVFEMMEALALCHSVTPVESDGDLTYQASSPDEIAIVNYTKQIGMKLIKRNRVRVTIKTPLGPVTYRILQTFPFNSDTKRMGIILQKESMPISSSPSKGSFTEQSGSINTVAEEVEYNSDNGINKNEILFFEKGADSAMKPIIEEVEWAEEETDNMARDGLRTLLIAKKVLSVEEYDTFCNAYEQAKLEIDDRAGKMLAIQISLENNMELLGLTGVEDKLQDRVRPTLENLRNANMKVWMLTGDKIETAISIALSSRLLNKSDSYLIISNCETREELVQHLRTLATGRYNALVIDGVSLAIVISHMLNEFIMAARDLSCIVGCRYSPTQKAIMAAALRKVAGETVCCIGDGGNDVSMITEADVGIGIEGKEGNQASLAADFSIKNFADVSDLFFWHGRRCYKNTATIASIIIHRGMMIAIVQAIFCALVYFVPISVFQGKMLMLFICYTFMPFLALIRTQDVSRQIVIKFPEIYKELRNANLLSTKNLFAVNFNSFFQASAIMLVLFFCLQELFALSILVFTCIIINEQALICLVIEHINLEVLMMCGSSLLMYALSFLIFSELNHTTFKAIYFLHIAIANSSAISLKAFLRIYTKCFKPASYLKLGTAEQ